MKGAISLKSQQFYTYLDVVFDAIDHIQLNYNWLLTNYECNIYPDERIPCDSSFDYVWLTGEQITEIVQAHHIQYIWGVLSAFPTEISIEEVLEYRLPYADGYEGFWHGKPTIQHPLAHIEIVPWDSTLVLLIAKDDNLVYLFINNFPNSMDLTLFNSSDISIW